VYPQSSTFSMAAHWPFLVPGQRLHLGFALGLMLAIGAWAWLTYTASGLRVRLVGAGARAAASAGGIDVARTTFGVFLVSGALAGLAGASEVGGVTFALYEGLSPGYGYTAIAVALLARLDPRWVIASAVLFGALEAGAAAMQRDAGVPSVVVQVFVALTVLATLAATHLGAAARARAMNTRAEDA
jgi:general nucleoside transport system permease protein